MKTQTTIRLPEELLEQLYPIRINPDNPIHGLVRELAVTADVHDMIELVNSGKWIVLNAVKGNDSQVIYRLGRLC